MRTALFALLTLAALCTTLHAETIPIISPEGFSAWKTESGTWTPDGSVLTQEEAGPPRTITWLPTKAYSDIDISVDFLIDPVGSGVRSPGLVYRAADSEHYYYIHVDQRNSQIVWVRSAPANEWTVAERHRPYDLESNRWYTLRVLAKGPEHQVYLDGELIFTETDDTIPSGVIGLRTGQGRISFANLYVEGDEVPLEKPFKVFRAPFFNVCTDAGTGAYEAFPDVCLTTGGELLCVFYAGYGHVSVPNDALPKGARISMVRSTDLGKTWSEAEVVVDTDIDDRDPSITQLSNGDLLVTYMSYDPGRRPGTHQIFTVRSSDHGETWGEPQRVLTNMNGNEAISEPVREMPDGRLLLPVYGELSPAWPKVYVSELLESRDMGKTWRVISRIESEQYMLCEPSILRRPDGTLLMLIRPDMTWCESEDGGRTWSEVQPVGVQGDAPYLLLTSKNVLLCGFRHRVTSSTKVMASHDFGKTWDEPVMVDKVLGAYPSMAELPDGRIIFIYYTEGAGSDIRGVYLKADENGIELLRQEAE